MNYHQVDESFFNGEIGRRLRGSPATQVIALYLVANPCTNILGLYHLSLPTVAHETGVSGRDVRKALGTLADVGYAFYDDETEFCWVVDAARVRLQLAPGKALTIGEKGPDKRIATVRAAYGSLPANSFLGPFFDHYAGMLHLESRREFEGASFPFPSSTAGGAEGHPSSTKRHQRGINQIRSVPDHDQSKITHKALPGLVTVADDGFKVFWQAYPNRKGKGAARKAWTKLAPSSELQGRILSAIDRQKRGADWLRDGGRFIPHPASWLNAERWTDEAVALPTVSDRTLRTLKAVQEADALTGELV